MALANLLVPSFELLKTAVYGILGYRIFFFSFLFVLWKFFKKPKSNLQIKILAFFYLLYWFFVGEFYNCSISTESITGRYPNFSKIISPSLKLMLSFRPVDSSDLLYSESQILNTKKTPCFPEGEPCSFCDSLFLYLIPCVLFILQMALSWRYSVEHLITRLPEKFTRREPARKPALCTKKPPHLTTWTKRRDRNYHAFMGWFPTWLTEWERK